MTTKDLISLADIPLFAGLTPDVLAHLHYSSHTHKLETREILFNAGDRGNNMYIISSGKMRIWVDTPSGHALELATLGPNEVVGELEIFDGKPRSASAQALEYTLLVALPREAIFDAIGKNPGVAVHLITILSARLRNNNQMRLDDLSERRLIQRLARLLLMLGESRPAHTIPQFDAEQAAALLQADSRLTQILLQEMAADGLIMMDNPTEIVLVDTPQLHQLAG